MVLEWLKDIQRRVGTTPDGIWGPETRTALEQYLPELAVPSHPKLSQDILEAAIASQRKWGIPASVSLAQFAVESAWGQKLAGRFNPFGIKAVGLQDSTVQTTREETKDGKSYYIKAGFRNFNSFEEAFDEHGKLLATSKYYVNARSKLPNPDAFADALTGVYATANNYGATLKSIMRSQDLYKYNEIK